MITVSTVTVISIIPPSIIQTPTARIRVVTNLGIIPQTSLSTHRHTPSSGNGIYHAVMSVSPSVSIAVAKSVVKGEIYPRNSAIKTIVKVVVEVICKVMITCGRRLTVVERVIVSVVETVIQIIVTRSTVETSV